MLEERLLSVVCVLKFPVIQLSHCSVNYHRHTLALHPASKNLLKTSLFVII